MAVTTEQQTGQDNTTWESDDMYDNHSKLEDTLATLIYSNTDLDSFLNNDMTEMSALFTLFREYINIMLEELNRTVKNVSGDDTARWTFSKNRTGKLVVSDGTDVWTFNKDR